ncbi:MAG: CapA family protein [bacterium]|nr:CapA family protein [bacterium]
MPKLDNLPSFFKQTFITATLVVLSLTVIFLLNSTSSGRFVFTKPSSTNYNLKPTTLFFAGDIMLSRNVGVKIALSSHSFHPFQNVYESIQNADLAFANLESPFSDSGPPLTEGLVFKAEPDNVNRLKIAGFDVLSTANNHSFDQGVDGIEQTLKILQKNKITPLGTGLNCHDGTIMIKNQIKFGILAYSYAAHNDGGKVPDPLVCDWKDTEQVARDIQSLKLNTDFVIISAHMGEEYQRVPEQINIDRVHRAIDAGADIFVGHHPHWIQTIEQYEGKWIFYSLGNFVFDQMWSTDTREGMTVLINFNNDKINTIELRPIIIEDYCCPRPADEEETKSILNKIGLTSRVLLDNN